jgi:hypothetical protein
VLGKQLDNLGVRLDTIANRLGPVGTNLYDRLGLVNVRIYDMLGVEPLTATVVGGLAVTPIVGSGIQHHVIVDSGTVNVGNSPHVVVDSGTIDVGNTPHVNVDNTVSVIGSVGVNNTPHVIVDSGSVSASVSNIPHVIVDSGSIGINNVVHTIVDSGTVSISGTPTVYARQQAWGIVGKNWVAVRGMDHTLYQTLVNNTHYEWSDTDTCSLIAIQSAMSSTNTSYANGLGSDAVAMNRYRTFVKADAI